MIGRDVQLAGRPGTAASYTVVGVVEDVRTRTLEAEPLPQLYVPFGPTPGLTAAIVVRGEGEAHALGVIRGAVREVDPTLPVFNTGPLSELVLFSATERRERATLAFLLSGIAAVLAGLGVYALVDYSARRRTRDMGIRMALGATRTRATVGLMLEGLLPVAAGVAAGTAISMLLARLGRSLVYGVSTGDVATYCVAVLALLILGALASAVPAMRATRLSPAEAIRSD